MVANHGWMRRVRGWIADSAGTRTERYEMRNMHGVDQDNGVVRLIAGEAKVHAGFVAAMIEYYTDEVADDERYALVGANAARGIVLSAMFGAFRYNEQDDDADEEQTQNMRMWVADAAMAKAGL